ncbi:hypothetical protein LINGRAHAP2_LOCUS8309 [Linum grandiflorum]
MDTIYRLIDYNIYSLTLLHIDEKKMKSLLSKSYTNVDARTIEELMELMIEMTVIWALGAATSGLSADLSLNFLSSKPLVTGQFLLGGRATGL